MSKEQVYYVYTLATESGTVEYVGQTTNPKRREYEHFRRRYRPNAGHGRFLGRNDLKLSVVQEFSTKEESFKYQEELQIKYDLPTDSQRMGENSMSNGIVRRKLTLEEAQSIRSEYSKGGTSMLKLGNKYNVSFYTVFKIVHNVTYTK